MSQSHYSLRWNNHQNHLLAAFDALLQAETLVDVTLVCTDAKIRAHKVVLSACSSYFQKMFSENPCKHPVIVLKDFSIREVSAVIEFMYKGEVSVMQEQLENLIKVAENLEVKGLTQSDPYVVDKEMSSINQTSTPSTSPNDFDRGYYGRPPVSGSGLREHVSPSSPLHCSGDEPAPKLPHMFGLAFSDSMMPRSGCQSPIPRRKQARPRRVSGETPANQENQKPPSPPPQTPPCDEPAPENLCVRKPYPKDDEKVRAPASPELDLVRPAGGGKEFRPSPPVGLPPTLSMKQEIDSHSPVPYPPPSMSALTMTPPHGKFFGLESHLGLFPPGLENCRTPLFDIGDIRTPPDPQLFVKKKMGRPKGQHSAPRGGPPRSWTNAELTEALQHVWNKKMTTSQASRIFGIPYNSLLMYVRGKYGKSLKLEQLRKDCIGGPPAPVDLLGMNNNAVKNERDGDQPQPNTRPSSTEEQHPPAPVFNPFAPGFYPDFGAGFPIPVSMIHLLPPSDKSRDHYGSQAHDDDVKKEVDEEDMFRPPALSIDDRRELVQQNGQD